MECTDCSKITRDGFEKEILFGEKKTRYESVFCMLNIPHHIRSSGYYYCYCDKKKKVNVKYVPSQLFLVISTKILNGTCLM